MAELKTKPNERKVDDFLQNVEHEKRRKDSLELLKLFKKVTGEKPRMWGESIVGFGDYHYKYDSGREGDWFKTGFSPRKQNLSLYLMAGFDDYEELLSRLGKHKTGKSCLYVNKLEDIDMNVLEKLIRSSYHFMTEQYG